MKEHRDSLDVLDELIAFLGMRYCSQMVSTPLPIDSAFSRRLWRLWELYRAGCPRAHIEFAALKLSVLEGAPADLILDFIFEGGVHAGADSTSGRRNLKRGSEQSGVHSQEPIALSLEF